MAPVVAALPVLVYGLLFRVGVLPFILFLTLVLTGWVACILVLTLVSFLVRRQETNWTWKLANGAMVGILTATMNPHGVDLLPDSMRSTLSWLVCGLGMGVLGAGTYEVATRRSGAAHD